MPSVRLALACVALTACGGTPGGSGATEAQTSSASTASGQSTGVATNTTPPGTTGDLTTSAPDPTTGGTTNPGTTNPGNTTVSTTTAGNTTTTGDTGDDTFTPFPCDPGPPDLDKRLCDEAADPEGALDKIFIHCQLEGACFAPPAVPAKDQLLVFTWNIERGLKIDEQIAALKTNPNLPDPDVLLLSEIDRGCSRTDNRAIAWELAEALEMNFVYGVEFTELPREGGSGGTVLAPCEHGNAIMARYPIGNVELVRHAENKSWYDGEEPRLGGRMFLKADLAVGPDRLHVYTLHFESGAFDGAYRAAQSAEIAEHGLLQPHRVILGGDMNAALYFLDLGNNKTEETTKPLFDRGYLDAHQSLPADQRTTHDPALVLDLMFAKGPYTSEPGICSFADCPDLSDHTPIWATVAVK